MNLVSEQQFNEAMQDPPLAAELARMLVDDLGIAIAILGGPNGNPDIYKKIIFRMRIELLAGAEHAKVQLDAHLTGKSIFIPGVTH